MKIPHRLYTQSCFDIYSIYILTFILYYERQNKSSTISCSGNTRAFICIFGHNTSKITMPTTYSYTIICIICRIHVYQTHHNHVVKWQLHCIYHIRCITLNTIHWVTNGFDINSISNSFLFYIFFTKWETNRQTQLCLLVSSINPNKYSVSILFSNPNIFHRLFFNVRDKIKISSEKYKNAPTNICLSIS